MIFSFFFFNQDPIMIVRILKKTSLTKGKWQEKNTKVNFSSIWASIHILDIGLNREENFIPVTNINFYFSFSGWTEEVESLYFQSVYIDNHFATVHDTFEKKNKMKQFPLILSKINIFQLQHYLRSLICLSLKLKIYFLNPLKRSKTSQKGCSWFDSKFYLMMNLQF